MKTVPSASHVHGVRSAKQLSKATWPDFEKFFTANNGVWGGCWCMYFHAPEGWNVKHYEQNRKAKRSLVNEGHAHGTLVYCGKDPVGWCQFGPKEELPKIDRKKGYALTSKDAWRITCFFISRDHRKMGFAEFAVEESVNTMSDLGVVTIEAYPVEGNLSASLLWSGTPALFEGAGFSPVRRLGKNSWIYSLRRQ